MDQCKTPSHEGKKQRGQGIADNHRVGCALLQAVSIQDGFMTVSVNYLEMQRIIAVKIVALGVDE